MSLHPVVDVDLAILLTENALDLPVRPLRATSALSGDLLSRLVCEQASGPSVAVPPHG